ncbi:hypothetical protein [Zestomonas carbonaria]|uniref:Uncharacterized protein n=1 Tax=Zestomonas carbonaria TaxID=2762745 RepID=A0A7U7IAE1_9GAMM|nr:hypothetical protein [Pseudomonas carbonaria]CAD5107847.1 hypothetical protein PSEWESI4_02124 [Pseudomonas carbonaria]
MPLLGLLLFWRRPWRDYALLDGQGVCRALRRSRSAPQGQGWVAVRECRLAWLHHPLPASARLESSPPSRPRQALAN